MTTQHWTPEDTHDCVRFLGNVAYYVGSAVLWLNVAVMVMISLVNWGRDDCLKSGPQLCAFKHEWMDKDTTVFWWNRNPPWRDPLWVLPKDWKPSK